MDERDGEDGAVVQAAWHVRITARLAGVAARNPSIATIIISLNVSTKTLMIASLAQDDCERLHIPDALHLATRHLLPAAVVELGGARSAWSAMYCAISIAPPFNAKRTHVAFVENSTQNTVLVL